MKANDGEFVNGRQRRSHHELFTNALADINPLSYRSGGKPPPRRSDIGFIVKHLPRAVDPETARHGKHNAPTQGGWPRETPQSHATDDETSACVNDSYGRSDRGIQKSVVAETDFALLLPWHSLAGALPRIERISKLGD
jgi:hypothetical protein